MCAIFGVVGWYEEDETGEAFACLSHRGVDESTILKASSFFTGVHRLAITNTNQSQTQPFVKESVTLVFNGEIYNYRALAETLELGETSQSEVEVLYAAYKKWNDDFVLHLRGMFAIVLIEENTVKLFRDPFGKKPLYYTSQNGRLLFSSELKAISKLRPPFFDRAIIREYLSYQAVLSPHTFYTQTMQVSAGAYVVWNKNNESLTTHQYYSPLDTPITLHTQAEAVETIEAKLMESVALRLPKEVRYAALLSGGLDSSLIAAMASKHEALHTFCIGYEGYESHDERPFARITAEHIGSTHHEVLFGKTDFLQTIKEVIEILDEPLGDPAMLPLHHLMKKVSKEGFKVVLTGDGSDELFMGYRTYKEYLDLEQASDLKFKNWLRNYFKAHFSMHKEWEWYKRIFEGSTLFRSSAEVFTDLQQNRLLKMNVPDNHSLKAIKNYMEDFEKSHCTSPIQWYSFLDLKVMLAEVFLRKLDRMSMAHSVEARSPFLDKEVVAAVFGCEPSLRLTHIPKEILKTIAKKYLPKEIIDRKKKGFNYPFLQWLNESNELDVIRRVQEKTGMFQQAELDALLEQGKQGMFAQHIFSLYMLCKWMERHKM